MNLPNNPGCRRTAISADWTTDTSNVNAESQNIFLTTYRDEAIIAISKYAITQSVYSKAKCHTPDNISVCMFSSAGAHRKSASSHHEQRSEKKADGELMTSALA